MLSSVIDVDLAIIGELRGGTSLSTYSVRRRNSRKSDYEQHSDVIIEHDHDMVTPLSGHSPKMNK